MCCNAFERSSGGSENTYTDGSVYKVVCSRCLQSSVQICCKAFKRSRGGSESTYTDDSVYKVGADIYQIVLNEFYEDTDAGVVTCGDGRRERIWQEYFCQAMV